MVQQGVATAQRIELILLERPETTKGIVGEPTPSVQPEAVMESPIELTPLEQPETIKEIAGELTLLAQQEAATGRHAEQIPLGSLVVIST